MLSKSILIVLFFSVIACKKIPYEGEYNLVIKEGNHACNVKWPHYERSSEETNNTLTFEVIFHESCIYNLHNDNQSDISKLMGFKDKLNPDENSDRLGWRYDTIRQQIEITYYQYVNGERINPDFNTDVIPIKSIFVNIGEPVICSIQLQNDKCIYNVNEWHAELPIGNYENIIYGSWFYFGGDSTAPHDMKIKIKFLSRINTCNSYVR